MTCKSSAKARRAQTRVRMEQELENETVFVYRISLTKAGKIKVIGASVP